VCVFP